MHRSIGGKLLLAGALLGGLSLEAFATQILQDEPEVGGPSYSGIQVDSFGRVGYFFRANSTGPLELRIDGSVAVRPQGDITSVLPNLLMSPTRYVVRVEMAEDNLVWISGPNVWLVPNPQGPHRPDVVEGPDLVHPGLGAPFAIASNGDVLGTGGSGGLFVSLAEYTDNCNCSGHLCYATFGGSSNISPFSTRFGPEGGLVHYRRGSQDYTARYGVNNGSGNCTADEPSGPPAPDPTAYGSVVETQPDGSEILYRINPDGQRVPVAQTGEYFQSLMAGPVSANGTVAFRAMFRRPAPAGGNWPGYFSSDNLASPRIANSHRLDDGTLESCELHAVDNAGRVVVTCRLTRYQGETPSHSRALILADGGTDFPAPDEPVEEAKWITDSGDYAETNNWDVGAIPAGDQLALFDRVGQYTVTFAGQPSASRAGVQRGDVTFSGGGYRLTTTDLYTPSLRVGTSGRLFLAQGFDLETIHTRIGTGAGPGTVDLADGGTTWNNQGRLSIGGNGVGTLRMILGSAVTAGETRVGDQSGSQGLLRVSDCGDDTTLRSGNLAVGLNGAGTMEILGQNCGVASDLAKLGVEPGASGFADVRGYWGVPDGITVGHRGAGEVDIAGTGWIDGATTPGEPASYSAIGLELGGEGVVRNSGGELDAGNFTVGARGRGEYEAIAGARTRVALDLVIGQDSLGEGVVIAEGSGANGPTRIDVGGLIRVARSGVGELVLCDGAVATASGASVAINDGGVGTLVVDNALLEVVTGIRVGLSLTIDEEPESRGIGRLEVRGGGQVIAPDGVTVDGPGSVISGNASILGSVTAENQGQINPGTSPGTLTIDGNLALDGGILVIEMSGTADGEYDVLNVTGDANLERGTVRFAFQNFLPQQGNEFRFVRPQTLSVADDVVYEYQGANPGFEFAVDADGEGNLTFTALNDAIDDVFANGFE